MGPFSPRQSEPLAALPPLSRPRRSSSRGPSREGGCRRRRGCVRSRAASRNARSASSPSVRSVSDLVMMIETVPRDLTPRIKGRIFFLLYMYISLLEATIITIELSETRTRDSSRLLEISRGERLSPNIRNRFKPEKTAPASENMASREEDGKSPAPAEGRQSIYIAR